MGSYWRQCAAALCSCGLSLGCSIEKVWCISNRLTRTFTFIQSLSVRFLIPLGWRLVRPFEIYTQKSFVVSHLLTHTFGHDVTPPPQKSAGGLKTEDFTVLRRISVWIAPHHQTQLAALSCALYVMQYFISIFHSHSGFGLLWAAKFFIGRDGTKLLQFWRLRERKL